jgi:hypothetical protein
LQLGSNTDGATQRSAADRRSDWSSDDDGSRFQFNSLIGDDFAFVLLLSQEHGLADPTVKSRISNTPPASPPHLENSTRRENKLFTTEAPIQIECLVV